MQQSCEEDTTMRPNLLMEKLRPREVKPLAQGDATDEWQRPHGNSGPLATSLRSEPLLFTSSEPRPTLLQVPRSGGQGQRFRRKVRRTAHSPQCQGHSLQHSCPLTWPSPALALFPEPCISAPLNFSVLPQTPYAICQECLHPSSIP